MPNFAKLGENLKKEIFKTYAGDASKMLLHLGTLGWILSAAAQVFAIKHNKKVPSDQKKFLIPQEMTDAAVNILSFYFVTRTIQDSARKLVGSGFITTPKIKAFCKAHNIELQKFSTDIRTSINNAIKENKTTLKIARDKLDINKKAECKRVIDEFTNFDDTSYEKFESGVKMAGGLFGSILSSNVITPIVRNHFASKKQKEALNYEHRFSPLVNTTMPKVPTEEKNSQIASNRNLLSTYPTGNGLKI
ncbi:hypothetical protein KBA27_02565 [bacterium]|nr:hypothetical protein [bacterium]